MKFLIIEKITGQIPEDALKSSAKGIEYFNELKKNGKLIDHYHFAGIPGGAIILNVESNNELGEILIKSPFYPFTNREIYPLMNEDIMVKAEQSIV